MIVKSALRETKKFLARFQPVAYSPFNFETQILTHTHKPGSLRRLTAPAQSILSCWAISRLLDFDRK